MKRKGASILVIYVLIISLFSVTFILKTIPTVNAVTIYVDDVPGSGPDNPPEDYTSIQSAISAASPGDIVFVYSGYYDEQIFPVGGVILRGEHRSNTTVKSSSSYPTCYISWATGNVVIENISIIGAPSPWSIESSAIEIFRDSSVTIRNCSIKGNDGEGGGLGFGIDIEDIGNSVSITNSSIYGGKSGASEQAYIRVFSTCSAILLNTTHGNSSSVEAGGSLTIKWFLHVKVIDINGDPIENVHIYVNDTYKNNVFNGYTDLNGYVRWIICREKVIPGFNYNPYKLNASKDGKKALGKVNMNKSQDIWLLLDELKFTLFGGWNLISFPTIHYDTNIDYVLSSITGNYDLVQWYNPVTGNWQDSNGGLSDIYHDMGFWLHMKNDAILNIMENRVPVYSNTHLYSGWNLIGYPSLVNKPVTDALSSIDGNYTAIKYYNTSDDADPWKNYHINKPSNDLYEMEMGQGYWIYVENNCILSIEGI